MKASILAVSILLVSSFSFAGVQFQQNSPLLPGLQTLIASKLVQVCKEATAMNLIEVSTLSRKDKIDNGMIDMYYKTTFAVVPGNSGMSSNVKRIVVESAWYAGSNGDPREVSAIKGCSQY